MSERSLTNQLKDQLTLWLLLYKLDKFQFKTGKLKLQKLMYLIDVFGSINSEKPTGYTFRFYKHGPYTKEIQCDVEHLVAKGLVRVKETTEWNPSQDRSFQYQILEPNIERARQLISFLEYENIEKTIDFIIQAAGYLSSKNIQTLVYSEPNFIQAKELYKRGIKPFAFPIDPKYEFIAVFEKIVVEEYSINYGYSPSKDLVLRLYLNFVKSIEKETQNAGFDGTK